MTSVPATSRNERILVIEDDPGVSASIEHAAAGTRLRVELRQPRTGRPRPRDRHEFELVITDLRLPDGDGM